ncbi:MAG: O-antigen ligase family protein [Planctomycetota bacterium]|nr:O-antigen ligase family protein [Planctomycetota bacterium]
MANHSDAVEGNADSPQRPHAWALILLLGFAAALAIPDLFDAGIVKRAATALLAALVILPLLAVSGREAVRDWFTSTGARLLILVTGLSLVAAFMHLDEAAVTDRLLTFGLLNVAAMLGVLASQRDPEALGRALRWAALIPALVAWTQALGWEQTLTPGPHEIVALSGNSTRAGALLALGALAWIVHLACAKRHGKTLVPARLTLSIPPMIALALVSGALILTRARGARMAAAGALAALLIGALIAAARASRTANARPVLRPALLGLVAGIALAASVGGSDALMAHKLVDDGAILDGGDLTTNVRLALADSSTDMLAAHPWTGVGLGRFRAEFPPFRDAFEASLPGLEGASTEARHPHNEFLLVATEGGVVAALFLLLFLVLTLRRAGRLAREFEAPGVVAFLVLIAGTVLALVQDAWTDPATALPLFAAVGFVWAPREGERRLGGTQPPGENLGARAVTVATLFLALGLGLLAWPRLDAHLSLRSFYLRAQEAGGVDATSFAVLQHAAEVAPGDIDIQRMVLFYGEQYAPHAPDTESTVAAIKATERARERLAQLAPHAN